MTTSSRHSPAAKPGPRPGPRPGPPPGVKPAPKPGPKPAATQPLDPRFTGLVEAARALQPRTVALRRAVHRHPEVGLHLPATQSAIVRALDGLPLRVRTGGGCSSVIAVLDGGRPGPTVLLRADMDGLPLTERTGLAFASENPKTMHACGHDTHVAMLASAARLLATRRDALAGQVIFMFQPGEEGFHGARVMLDEGLLDVAGGTVRSALALHITATTRSGAIACRPGPLMASSDTFRVKVLGRGGHGAYPHEALDPVPAAAAMIGALQTMVTRRINPTEPAVLTVGKLIAGTTSNIIPESAVLEGTVRALSEETRAVLLTELDTVCRNVGAAYGCTVELVLDRGYPVTVNDPAIAARVLELADTVLGAKHAELMDNPVMGSEDFAYVLREVPGALAFLGACPPGVTPAQAAANHSDRVLFDESAMELGVALYAGFALDQLK